MGAKQRIHPLEYLCEDVLHPSVRVLHLHLHSAVVGRARDALYGRLRRKYSEQRVSSAAVGDPSLAASSLACWPHRCVDVSGDGVAADLVPHPARQRQSDTRSQAFPVCAQYPAQGTGDSGRSLCRSLEVDGGALLEAAQVRDSERLLDHVEAECALHLFGHLRCVWMPGVEAKGRTARRRGMAVALQG